MNLKKLSEYAIAGFLIFGGPLTGAVYSLYERSAYEQSGGNYLELPVPQIKEEPDAEKIYSLIPSGLESKLG